MKPLFEIISSSSKQQGLQNHSHLSQAMQALFLGQEQPSSTCFCAKGNLQSSSVKQVWFSFHQSWHSTMLWNSFTVSCLLVNSMQEELVCKFYSNNKTKKKSRNKITKCLTFSSHIISLTSKIRTPLSPVCSSSPTLTPKQQIPSDVTEQNRVIWLLCLYEVNALSPQPQLHWCCWVWIAK